MEQIDRDVKRTHPDMHFFSGDSSFAKSNQVNHRFLDQNFNKNATQLADLSTALICRML